MANAADLRRHADHCRYLADFTPGAQDRQELRNWAEEFEADAKRSERDAAATGVEPDLPADLVELQRVDTES